MNMSGVLLQSVSTLLEKMLTLEEGMAEKGDIVPPSELYFSISEFVGPIGGSIALLMEETRNRRNKNEKGIYFRKVLLLLDNYFKNSEVMKRYPDTSKLEQLFPAFNEANNRLYAEKATVLDHPGGNKKQPVEEFGFIHKYQSIASK